MTARVFHIRSSFFIRFGLFVRLIPDGQIRSQNFVLIIFPRKFGPISGRCIVYILIFTENLTVILNSSHCHGHSLQKWILLRVPLVFFVSSPLPMSCSRDAPYFTVKKFWIQRGMQKDICYYYWLSFFLWVLFFKNLIFVLLNALTNCWLFIQNAKECTSYTIKSWRWSQYFKALLLLLVNFGRFLSRFDHHRGWK